MRAFEEPLPKQARRILATRVLADDLASYQASVYDADLFHSELTFGYRPIGPDIARLDILRVASKRKERGIATFTNMAEYYLGIIVGELFKLHDIIYSPAKCLVFNYTAGECILSPTLGANITSAPDLLYFVNSKACWEFDRILSQTPYYIDVSWCVSDNPLFRDVAKFWKDDPTNSVFKWSLCG